MQICSACCIDLSSCVCVYGEVVLLSLQPLLDLLQAGSSGLSCLLCLLETLCKWVKREKGRSNHGIKFTHILTSFSHAQGRCKQLLAALRFTLCFMKPACPSVCLTFVPAESDISIALGHEAPQLHSSSFSCSFRRERSWRASARATTAVLWPCRGGKTRGLTQAGFKGNKKRTKVTLRSKEDLFEF